MNQNKSTSFFFSRSRFLLCEFFYRLFLRLFVCVDFFVIQYHHQQNDLTFKRWQMIPLIITQSEMGREALFRIQKMEQHHSKREKQSEQQQQPKQNNGGAHKNSDKLCIVYEKIY